jgi:flavin reductase (DIM6/NTAB) family NADH-FMN oxidoreductase RutF
MSKATIDLASGLRLLEPGPVVLVTSMFRSHPNVMTAAWISPLGFDPPMISLAIHPGRLTHELVSKSEMFGASIPTMDLLKAIHRCGLVSGHDQDKFESAALTPIDPLEIEAPRIDECVAHLECGVLQRVSMADHDLFIGEILAAEADRDYFRDRWFAANELPLVHHIAAEHYAGMTRSYAVTLEDQEEEA